MQCRLRGEGLSEEDVNQAVPYAAQAEKCSVTTKAFGQSKVPCRLRGEGFSEEDVNKAVPYAAQALGIATACVGGVGLGVTGLVYASGVDIKEEAQVWCTASQPLPTMYSFQGSRPPRIWNPTTANALDTVLSADHVQLNRLDCWVYWVLCKYLPLATLYWCCGAPTALRQRRPVDRPCR